MGLESTEGGGGDKVQRNVLLIFVDVTTQDTTTALGNSPGYFIPKGSP
jgi:hypothetical protein